jgi:hypothetical protein
VPCSSSRERSCPSVSKSRINRWREIGRCRQHHPEVHRDATEARRRRRSISSSPATGS